MEDFNYDAFKQAYDSDPMTQGLVHRYDQNGVELNSKQIQSDVAPSDAEQGSDDVAQMARHATRKARG